MLDTERLLILPLSYSQLLKYVENNNSLETDLGINNSPRIISPELKEALELAILPKVAENKPNHLFFTLWTVVLKTQNRMIGDLCFMGNPDDDGKVEIGYGTYEDFRGNGFMTEAVGGIVNWAKRQPSVKSITASTDKSNVASMVILQKNGFEKSGETDDFFHWKLQF